MDNAFILWKIFNAIVDCDYDEKIPLIPVVADCEEIEIIARRFCTYCTGQTLDLNNFKMLSTELEKFSFGHVLNLWDTGLCLNLDQNLINSALKELQDEIVYEAIKKVNTDRQFIYNSLYIELMHSAQ